MSITNLTQPFVPKPDTDYPKSLRIIESTMGALDMRTATAAAQRLSPNFENEQANVWLTTCAAVQAKLAEDKKAVGQILTSRALSAEGRVLQLGKDATKRVDNYTFVANVSDDTRKVLDRSTDLGLAPMIEKPKGVNPYINFWREQEIRSSIPKNEAERRIIEAEKIDDRETIRAIFDAPGAPWVSADIRRRVEESFMQRTNPELWTTIQSLTILREHMDSLVEQFRLWFLAMGLSHAEFTKVFKG